MAITSWHYQCSHCTTWAVTVTDAGRYVRCNGCGGSKRFMFTDTTDPKIAEYARKNGIAHLPIPDSSLTAPCARCGTAKGTEIRMGRWICSPCYHAEIRPEESPKPLTPEEWETFKRAQRQAQADDDARMEAAYAAVERNQ